MIATFLYRALMLATPLIKQCEGLRLEAYPDPATGGEPWTIGYGATGKDITQTTVWTQQQADNDLHERLIHLGNQVMACLQGVPLTPCQLAALMSFTYNVGIGNLKSSTLLKKLKARDIDGAAAEFGRWIYANKKVMPGLVIRRRREAALFLTGQ